MELSSGAELVFSIGFYLLVICGTLLISFFVRPLFNCDPKETKIFPLNPMSFFLGMWFVSSIGLICLFLSAM